MAKDIEILYDAPLHEDELPPGISLAEQPSVIRKGDYLAYYNDHADLWHVKRVIRAGRAEKWTRDIHQRDIKYVTHDEVPIEGKDGTAASHYAGYGGYGETNTRQLASDGGRPWYLIDLASSTAAEWIARTDQLWVEHHDAERAEQERTKGTPAAFQARMNTRAAQLDRMAAQADGLAASYRALAEEIRQETRGEWVK